MTFIFKLNKYFKTDIEMNENTIKISNAFGIGIDEEKKINIIKDMYFEINHGEIMYITGYSGSGKSVLLNLIYNKFIYEYKKMFVLLKTR
jgi:uncharacterized protein